MAPARVPLALTALLLAPAQAIPLDTLAFVSRALCLTPFASTAKAEAAATGFQLVAVRAMETPALLLAGLPPL
eukprot:2991620-Alexandrium_andersonii.AAC.1